MKIFVILAVCVGAVIAGVMHDEKINEKRSHRHTAPICYNSACTITGEGCKGWLGACAGICYCDGSGYEYRCYHDCDVFG